ncbi:hypothetical protein ABZT03_43040 [Streptomyces sp. NPDC005574]|uniref:hypothetical protein n=1 Tax=Streptomyces sp. NPDC005574 TaxID=3156891 RepID=UPI0033A14109
MTREERLALLPPEALAYIDARVEEAPEPTPELVEELRRIMTRPAGVTPRTQPAAHAA